MGPNAVLMRGRSRACMRRKAARRTRVRRLETPQPQAGECVTLTVTPHSRSLVQFVGFACTRRMPALQNELTSSTLIPALSLSFGFGPTWIRTSMSRALRNRSRRSMLNRASLPRIRSDTSG
jgi:hypothetical protein